MGDLLVDLADEIPPVVVDPRRPQAIFMMQENYFGSVMFGAISAKGGPQTVSGRDENAGGPASFSVLFVKRSVEGNTGFSLFCLLGPLHFGLCFGFVPLGD